MTIQEETLQTLCKKASTLFGGDPTSYSASTRFKEDLHCKSVNYVQLSAALEDVFDMEVPYMEFIKLETFGDAAEFMREKIEG